MYPLPPKIRVLNSATGMTVLGRTSREISKSWIQSYLKWHFKKKCKGFVCFFYLMRTQKETQSWTHRLGPQQTLKLLALWSWPSQTPQLPIIVFDAYKWLHGIFCSDNTNETKMFSHCWGSMVELIKIENAHWNINSKSFASIKYVSCNI